MRVPLPEGVADDVTGLLDQSLRSLELFILLLGRTIAFALIRGLPFAFLRRRGVLLLRPLPVDGGALLKLLRLVVVVDAEL